MLRPFGISSLLDYQAYGREGGICHFPYCDYVVDQGWALWHSWHLWMDRCRCAHHSDSCSHLMTSILIRFVIIPKTDFICPFHVHPCQKSGLHSKPSQQRWCLIIHLCLCETELRTHKWMNWKLFPLVALPSPAQAGFKFAASLLPQPPVLLVL